MRHRIVEVQVAGLLTAADEKDSISVVTPQKARAVRQQANVNFKTYF